MGRNVSEEDTKIVMPLLKEKIALKKREGINPIVVKSRNLLDEWEEKFPPKLRSKNKIYQQQVISTCCREEGFSKRCAHSDRPLLYLEW